MRVALFIYQVEVCDHFQVQNSINKLQVIKFNRLHPHSLAFCYSWGKVESRCLECIGVSWEYTGVNWEYTGVNWENTEGCLVYIWENLVCIAVNLACTLVNSGYIVGRLV